MSHEFYHAFEQLPIHHYLITNIFQIKVLTEGILEMLELTGGLLVQTEVPGETPKMVHNSEELMMAVQKVTILDDINRLYTMPDGSWLRLPAEAIDQVKDEARADNEIITQVRKYFLSGKV